ncbi:MAG: CHAT domain-containing protein [Cyanobacteria bacterium P01_D01_bin.36]
MKRQWKWLGKWPGKQRWKWPGKWQWRRCGLRRLKRNLWFLLLFVSSWVVWMDGYQPAAVYSSPHQDAVVVQASEVQASEVQVSEAVPWQQSLRAGLAAYEQGQFSAAIAQWQAARADIGSAPENRLVQAYLLNNLSIAHRALAQRSEAQPLLAESLMIVQSWPVQDLAYWEISARIFNSQGQMLWEQGQTQQALDSWQQAEVHYREAKNLRIQGGASGNGQTLPIDSGRGLKESPGLVSSQVNQALAYQELGLNAKALRQLSALARSLDDFSPRLRLVAVRELGKAFRRVGDFSTAQSVLEAGLSAADTASLEFENESESETDADEQGGIEPRVSAPSWQIALELGHTLRQRSHRMMAIGQESQAQSKAMDALANYERVIDQVSDELSKEGTAEEGAAEQFQNRLLRAQTQLNQLSYLIEMGRLEQAEAFWPQIVLSDLPDGRASVEAHISYAHSLACLQRPTSVACIRQEWQESELGQGLSQQGHVAESSAESSGVLATGGQLWSPLSEALAVAVRQSRSLADPLLESYALGELGHAYELAASWEDAISLTRQALSLLEDKQLPDAAYRWEWQLGRLYQQRDGQGDIAQAFDGKTATVLAYQQAIASLSAVRQNLLTVNLQVQFSFRDNVEPLYREYVSLLLGQSPRTTVEVNGAQPPSQLPSQADLAVAVNTLDALQLTELENFLGCNLSQLVNLNEREIDPQAAKIYPIILPAQLATIVDIPGQPLTIFSTPVSQSTVEATLRDLRQSLTLPGQTPAVLDSAGQLYDWLVAPLAPVLAEADQIQTLVFVPDGALRNIPMGVLYDGTQYLVEKGYAIAVAPQLDLFAPRTAESKLKILRGGIGLPQTIRGQQFPSIELIQAELNQIPADFTVAPALLDEAFTKANIEQQLASQEYSAIHWKTHGVFSSDPEETFLVTYEDGITANELSELVRSVGVRRSEPLELLVLSACETAQGDRRAVLGLAGMAVRAGTRSTLSTLWRADDGANTQLMAGFYKGIEAGLTKAQALQSAQQMLLSEVGYPAPYYWAPYVLVGNWL